MKLSDLYGVFNRSYVSVISITNPHGDYYEIKLQPKSGLTWVAGEHGIFTLPGKKVKGRFFRGFSFASTTDEGHILIGTRTGERVSDFKKQLLNMIPGDQVRLYGPFGWMKVQDATSPLVLIATGVGVTPMRALIKANIDKALPMTLIHTAKDYFLFGDELNNLSNKHQGFVYRQTNNRQEAQQQIENQAKVLGNEAYYFLSGSPSSIRINKKILLTQGIKRNRILSDLFFGY